MLRRTLFASAVLALAAGPGFAQQPITVKFGVLTDYSGPYTDLSGVGSTLAAQMAIEDFNAAGKGIRAEVVFADHQNKADVGANVARQWYDRDGVDVILDVANSAVALAVNQLTRERNKAFLASGPATSDLTGAQCSPNTVHWTYDTYALASGTGTAMTQAGGDSWFFLTADYAFGHALERDTTNFVQRAGGRVVGGVRTPFPTSDFSSFLLQAQASGAKVIGLANAGADTINSIKQAAEFGITQSGQKLAGLLVFLTDVHSLGLQTAQGLVLTESFYWDLNDRTRAWADRFQSRHPRNLKPTMIHAGVYASVMHYLKALEQVRSASDGLAVINQMKAMPTDDPLFGQGQVRADGRKVHDTYLFEVKSPAESRGAWDYYKLVRTIPAANAFRPLADGNCPLVRS
jgi:branched-chain amino acid transport system substrate-binding protein